MRNVILIVSVLCITLTNCSKSSPSPSPPIPLVGTWSLLSIKDSIFTADIIPAPFTVSISFSGNKVSGRTRVNQYFGDYTLVPSSEINMAVGSTFVFDLTYNVLEAKYLNSLSKVKFYHINKDTLTLSNDGLLKINYLKK